MDNRALDRSNIPEGKVFFRKLNGFNFLKPFKGPYSLNDLSKSSIRFEYPVLNMDDTIVELKIMVSGSQILKIKGKIAGPLDIKEYNRNHTVVHFLPFGSRKVYNTYRIKKKLDALLNEFSN